MTLDTWGSPPWAPSVGEISGRKHYLELAAEAKLIRMGKGFLEPLSEAFLPLGSTPTAYTFSLVIFSFYWSMTVSSSFFPLAFFSSF